MKSLEQISEWRDDTYSCNASMSIRKVCDCEFVLTVFRLSDIFIVMSPCSNYQQNSNVEIATSKCNLKFLKYTLIYKRKDADSISALFHMAEVMIEESGVDI